MVFGDSLKMDKKQQQDEQVKSCQTQVTTLEKHDNNEPLVR